MLKKSRSSWVRRSASISTTRRLEWPKLRARLAAMVDLPSPGTVLVMMILCRSCSLIFRSRRERMARIDSSKEAGRCLLSRLSWLLLRLRRLSVVCGTWTMQGMLV